jgi:phage anti-repressor protein
MAKDPREYGYEGEMAMSQLKGIIQHAQQLHDMLEPNTDLPEWVQSKITLAYDYMQTATDYMSTEMTEEAPANVTAGVAKFDPLLSSKKKTKILKRFKDM